MVVEMKKTHSFKIILQLKSKDFGDRLDVSKKGEKGSKMSPKLPAGQGGK